MVGFEETNLLGNVYYVNHLRWQGRCREMFLREHAPSVLDEMERGLVLVTTRCACEYLKELAAFDQVTVKMRLASLAQTKMSLDFEYWRGGSGGAAELAARGEQGIAFMRRASEGMVPAPVPEELRKALAPYAAP